MPTRVPHVEITFDPSADQFRERARRAAGSLLGLFLGDLEDKLFPNFLIRLIQKRTKAGLDADGATFKRYSEGYEKQGTPDLSVTGELLSSLTGKRDKDGFSVRPAGSHRGSVTAQLLASFLNKQGRTFLGYGPRDEPIIETTMQHIFTNVTANKIEAILSGRR